MFFLNTSIGYDSSKFITLYGDNRVSIIHLGLFEFSIQKLFSGYQLLCLTTGQSLQNMLDILFHYGYGLLVIVNGYNFD